MPWNGSVGIQILITIMSVPKIAFNQLEIWMVIYKIFQCTKVLLYLIAVLLLDQVCYVRIFFLISKDEKPCSKSLVMKWEAFRLGSLCQAVIHHIQEFCWPCWVFLHRPLMSLSLYEGVQIYEWMENMPAERFESCCHAVSECSSHWKNFHQIQFK